MTSDNPPFSKSLFRDEDLQRRFDKCGGWDLDLTTHQLFWSGATRRLSGVSQHDPVGYNPLLSLLQPKDRRELDIQHSIATGCKCYIQYRIGEVPERSLRVRARGGHITDKNGAPLRLRGMVLDIDHQKLIEELLLAREDHLRPILETAPDAKIVIDDYGIMPPSG